MSEYQKEKVRVECPDCKSVRTVCLGHMQKINRAGGKCGKCSRKGVVFKDTSNFGRKKGCIAWNKGLKMTLLCAHCKNLFNPKRSSRTKCCSKQCANRLRVVNGTHHFWKGGITDINFSVRSMTEYKQWKEKVIARDGFNCQECGVSSTPGHFELMHVDHIKPLSLILAEYRITNTDGARVCAELWDTENGQVLCAPCHKNGATWAGRVNNLTIST
jgi:hypothetical protein